jgi:hypothetical protein
MEQAAGRTRAYRSTAQQRLGLPTPALTDILTEQKLVATAKWISEKELWDKLRAEIETHRLRIRAELDAYRSRKRLAGKGPHSPDEKSSPKRP